jgi:type VI secretion system protein ImpJ
MTARAVHWHDGMFLRPHHFQAAQRSATEAARRNEKWNLHHNWGLRSIELDRDALVGYRLCIRSLKAVLPDGTPVAVPEDGLLPEVNLKPVLESASEPVTVFLALPQLSLGKANVAGRGEDELARYKVTALDLEDENTGVNPQPVQLRLPNLKLLLSNQDQTGFTVLPIAQIEKSTRVDATPQLDANYIPPLLACDAWPVLQNDILQSVCDRVNRKLDRLAGQLLSRQTGGIPEMGDPLLVAQLRELNQAATVLGVLAFAPGVHPLVGYVELCRLVGQLAIYDASRRPPALPRYDHDDLGGCYYAVKRYLDELLNLFLEPEYKERPFLGSGLRLQVALDAPWLDPVWSLYIGVRTPLDPAECVRLLTVPGQLDMKVGAGDRVDGLYRLGQAGLRFEPCPRPGMIPETPGEVFFQVSRDAPREWPNVQRSLTLALRLNENRVVGNIQNQRVLTVRTAGNQTATMQFTLFVVPQN